MEQDFQDIDELAAVIDADCRNDGSEGRAWSADQLRRITLQSVICFLMSPRKMMSWADFYVSLCECACCGLKRIPIQPRIEQNIFMLRPRTCDRIASAEDARSRAQWLRRRRRLSRRRLLGGPRSIRDRRGRLVDEHRI